MNGTTASCVYTVSNDGDAISGSGSDRDQFACCMTGSCTFHSFKDALINVTNDVVINIETSVVLSSNITIVNANNVLIKGQTVATVLCNNTANMHFVSCNSLTIEGIIWQGCGGLQFYNSSDVTIKNKYFHNSTR